MGGEVVKIGHRLRDADLTSKSGNESPPSTQGVVVV
jgi:hypothetical protein